MDIETDIRLLREEIAALSGELRPLQTEYDTLFKQVARFESDNRNLSKPEKPPVPPPEDEDVPPLIQYSCFDDSIRSYFESMPQKPEPSIDTEKLLVSIDCRTRGSAHALEESIWRSSGVTAFPIDDTLYDKRDDSLLGLRFDVMAHSTSRFLKPHYIILRRRQPQEKGVTGDNTWSVFRYTTPAYVPLDRLSHLLSSGENGLAQFVHEVRSYLTHVQYKHDKFDSVAKITYGQLPDATESDDVVVTRLQKDLECRHVSIHIQNSRGESHQIELICGLSSVETAFCTLSPQDLEAQTLIGVMLANAELTSMTSRFIKTFSYMKEKSFL
ncbi:Cenp-O kinetochore centromere component family protein [Clavispora lusitaniae]|uniref:Cenp-O kinetochore centromere component family protein n=1 Tax=Clavispora lusitaniae TaxID=36911 RepID=UPI0016B402E5|nr:hypothetical protein E0198_001591 [Clavispora lusitaniae]KAF7583436.1 Cenp-O kinetochore centromere component family protein [Clavispora lusitaniae]